MHRFQEMRRSYRDMIPLAGTGEPVGSIRHLRIAAHGTEQTIPLRLYFPLRAQKHSQLPLFLFMHGGGFVSGDLETHDVLLRAIANGAGCLVISVDYRLAPEHPFPAGLEDGYAALLWLAENAGELGGDSNRIVLGGDSAGGNLAAALAILARDRAGPKITGQWLMYPMLSNRMDSESWTRLGEHYFPTRAMNSTLIAAYVPQSQDLDGPLVAPLYDSLENLPPALIQTGGLDPLSDEGKAFALKLAQHGGEARSLFYPQFEHGFLQFYQDEKKYPNAQVALQEGIVWLREKVTGL